MLREVAERDRLELRGNPAAQAVNETLPERDTRSGCRVGEAHPCEDADEDQAGHPIQSLDRRRVHAEEHRIHPLDPGSERDSLRVREPVQERDEEAQPDALEDGSQQGEPDGQQEQASLFQEERLE